jgi:hypothetical protein
VVIDLLKTAEVVVGLVLAAFGAVVTVILWLHARMRAVAQDVARDAGGAQAATSARLDTLDTDLGRVRSEVGRVRDDVERLSRRVGGVERSMETVARAVDVAALRTDVAELKGMLLERTAAMGASIDTLYQAALRANQSGGRE